MLVVVELIFDFKICYILDVLSEHQNCLQNLKHLQIHSEFVIQFLEFLKCNAIPVIPTHCFALQLKNQDLWKQKILLN